MRPAVSVVVPFFGSEEQAQALAAALLDLDLRDGDEVIVADNSPWQAAATALLDTPVRVVPAVAERSSYHARNRGAEAVRTEWIAFTDADCVPEPDLLDAYFAPEPAEECGAVAGWIHGMHGQEGLVPRWTIARHWLDQSGYVNDPGGVPFGVTANLLVRRAAWESIGGFQEGIRSGGDYEFCRRLHEAGWTVEGRESAVVEHRHRETVTGVLRQAARYGAGRAWQNRRYGTAFPRPQLGFRLYRWAVDMARGLTQGPLEKAAFGTLDLSTELALFAGYVSENRAAAAYVQPPAAPPQQRVAVYTDAFPELSETFIANEVRALRREGWSVRVEAARRPLRSVPATQRELAPVFVEDDGILRRAVDLAWLVMTRPHRVIADLRARGTWAKEEHVRPLRAIASSVRRLVANRDRHLHVHFATGAALDGMRLARLAGIPWSVTAHAYDIYREPRNLRLKLRDAAFATSGCAYTVRDLQAIAPDAADRMHVIVMGVDAAEFARTRPYPGGRTVLAVGRLVEKKGFTHLVEAAARLKADAAVDRVLIVGDGPLRASLEAQIAAAGVGDVVELLGARDPSAVRELLEQADVLAMPCVVAADGDRDSMPVVVKEALAMEVPVVASDEVGLPEVVRPQWGRLVPPGDAAGLAAGLAELLALSPEERREMGLRGREHVLRACNTDIEAGKLGALVAGRR